MAGINIDELVNFMRDRAIIDSKERIKELKESITKIEKEKERWLADYITVSENYQKLVAENEELKEQLELNTANAVVIDMAQRLFKLKQAIKEIKEIIHFNKTNRLSGGADISIEQILQKISEVIDE